VSGNPERLPPGEVELLRELHEVFVVEGGGRWLGKVDKPRACHRCGADTPRWLRRVAGVGWECRWPPACLYRGRVADGVPKWRALRMLEADKVEHAERRRRR
jgi:hypothetical protein